MSAFKHKWWPHEKAAQVKGMYFDVCPHHDCVDAPKLLQDL